MKTDGVVVAVGTGLGLQEGLPSVEDLPGALVTHPQAEFQGLQQRWRPPLSTLRV